MKVKYQGAAVSLVVANAVIWFYAGYKTAKRALEKSYQDMLDADIADMRKHYKELSEDDMVQVMGMRDAYEEANRRANDAVLALAAYQVGSPEQTDVVESIETSEGQFSSVEKDLFFNPSFDPLHPANQLDPPPEPQIPRNRSYVDRSKPYVIGVDDFMLNEKEFVQRTLTYYQGDDTLAEDDEIIDSAARLKLVGMNLNNFGQDSNDANAVYIRNLPLKQDIEIVRSDGKYSVEVAGFGGNE